MEPLIFQASNLLSILNKLISVTNNAIFLLFGCGNSNTLSRACAIQALGFEN